MKFIWTLCVVCVFANYMMGSGLSHAATQDDYRLPDNETLNSQDVHLTLDPNKSSFVGTTTLNLDITAATRTLHYHIRDLKVRAVTLSIHGKSISLPVEKPNRYDIVTHELEHEIQGSMALSIDFEGIFSDKGQGLFVQRSGAEADYIFSQFQPMLARRVFPSLNEPSKKTSFQFTLTIPKNLSALHNTRAISTKIAPNTKTILFEKTAKIPSDVLAIAVGTFDKNVLEGTQYKSTFFSPKNLNYSFHEDLSALLNHSIAYLSNYLQSPFPYDKLDFFVAPFESSAAMENVGLIALSPNQIPHIGASDADMCRFHKLIAHEVSHMWFGNAITMRWYDDYWMNESFSEFFAAKIVRNFSPYQAPCTFTPQSVSLQNDNDHHNAVKRTVITESDQDATGQLVYSKGVSLLAMLEQAMGEDTFNTMLREYVEAHQGGIMSFDTFIAFLPEALVDTASSFLQQSSFPLVTLFRQGDDLYLKQQNFFEQSKLWSIPLTLKVLENNEVTYRNVLLATERMLLTDVSSQASVFIDTGGVGYFRYLNETGKAAFPLSLLSDAEKLSFIENNEALASAALVDYMTYVDTLVLTLNSLPSSRIESLKALGSLANGFTDFIPADVKAPFRQYLASVLPKDISWKSMMDTPNGGAWLSFYGIYLRSETAIKFAKKVVAHEDVVDVPFRQDVLKVAAASASDSEYKVLMNLFNKGDIAFKDDVLDALGYSQQRHHIRAFYELLLSDATREFVIDYRFQYPAFFAINRAFVSEYVIENKARILHRIPQDGAQWFVYNFMTACSAKESALIKHTFASWNNVEGLPEKLAFILNNVNTCAISAQKKVSSIRDRLNNIP